MMLIGPLGTGGLISEQHKGFKRRTKFYKRLKWCTNPATGSCECAACANTWILLSQRKRQHNAGLEQQHPATSLTLQQCSATYSDVIRDIVSRATLRFVAGIFPRHCRYFSTKASLQLKVTRVL